MPLDPKQIAGEAIMRGDLIPLGASSPFIPVKLPDEAGIGRIETPPPIDKRKGKRIYSDRPPRKRRWITKGEARALGYVIRVCA